MESNIADRRKAMKMSQANIARELGVHVQTVKRWEAAYTMPDRLDALLATLEARYAALPIDTRALKSSPKAGRPGQLREGQLRAFLHPFDGHEMEGLELDEAKKIYVWVLEKKSSFYEPLFEPCWIDENGRVLSILRARHVHKRFIYFPFVPRWLPPLLTPGKWAWLIHTLGYAPDGTHPTQQTTGANPPEDLLPQTPEIIAT